MKSHVRVAIIGGGIAGCSTLYHLTREGLTDVALIERDELTSGTTWHSAAQVTNFGPVQTMVGLKTHSIALYRELAADEDYPINYHPNCGGIRLAATQDHLDGYHHFVSMAKGMGVDFEVIDAAECARRHPLLKTDGLVGGLWDPMDGHIDPAQLCQALARRARLAGAEVHRHTAVQDISQTPSGEWVIHTSKGVITAEIVVNAAGYRVNEVAGMMGMQLPVVSMEHQYFLTESIPELELRDGHTPLIRDPIDDFYCRQEKQGLLVGIYEQGCKTWGMDGIDPDFTNALCPNDLDRCLDNMERVFKRLPCLEATGIHTVINGPITYSADGLPLVGKLPHVDNAYCIVGLRAGVGEGGGHGKILAEIIAHGESEWDTWCLDPRRFAPWVNTEYTALKAIEDYQNEFRFHMPHEHRPAGRPARTTPLYSRLQSLGAAFSVVNGWERASFYKPSTDFVEQHSFRFSNWHELVGREVQSVQNGVGLMEVNGFNRYEITGANALDWLDSLSCSRVPRAEGRLALTYFLTDSGNIMAEATLANIGANKVWYGSAAAAEVHDWDWLSARLPSSGVTLKKLTSDYTILVIAGPKARTLLAKTSPRTNCSAQAFPWLHVKEMFVGTAPVTAMCVSFSGESAFELHVKNEHAVNCFDTLWEAGADLGITPFGLYATESMRLEKGFRHWKGDLITEFDPYESNLARFVKMDKSNFLGKSALEAKSNSPPRRKFVTLTIDCDHASAHAGESLLVGETVVGTITSAGYGYRVEANLAMAFVVPEHAEIGTQMEVSMLGQRFGATVTEPCLYDPQHARARA